MRTRKVRFHALVRYVRWCVRAEARGSALSSRAFSRGTELTAAVIARYSTSGWSKSTVEALTSVAGALSRLVTAIRADAHDPDAWGEHEDLIDDLTSLAERLRIVRELRAPEDKIFDELVLRGVDAASRDPVDRWVVVQIIDLLRGLELTLDQAARVAIKLLRYTGVRPASTPSSLARSYQEYRNRGWTVGDTGPWQRQLGEWFAGLDGATCTLRVPPAAGS